MDNPKLQRPRRGLLLMLILLAGLAWLVYDDLDHPPLETMVACRMRCSYNYRDAKLVKRKYNNGIVYYECAQQ